MNQLATLLQRIQEYSTRTEGGYYISNFHTSNAYNGSPLFRVHFKRDQSQKPSSFDVKIHYAGQFVVDFKNPDQDFEQYSFTDCNEVIGFLTGK
ncbi:hypothetical protein [Larkinella soli]|uniref:hypothetical protein n=1 Tax=Larkinella soli TaxID=1770527 RepID=UPI000FFB11AC|nr:hypothetical protein [Larkinella soli]